MEACLSSDSGGGSCPGCTEPFRVPRDPLAPAPQLKRRHRVPLPPPPPLLELAALCPGMCARCPGPQVYFVLALAQSGFKDCTQSRVKFPLKRLKGTNDIGGGRASVKTHLDIKYSLQAYGSLSSLRNDVENQKHFLHFPSLCFLRLPDSQVTLLHFSLEVWSYSGGKAHGFIPSAASQSWNLGKKEAPTHCRSHGKHQGSQPASGVSRDAALGNPSTGNAAIPEDKR